jgi:uncharacterized protein YqjF (DUF2071 family)
LQQWTDVLFLHFPVAEEELRPHVPADVEVDTYHGQAWLGYVFFRLYLRPAWLPFVPGFSSLVEMNVRTYVRRRGQSGICFLRMYADNRLAIWASRWLTPLCYEPAKMVDERLRDGARRIECRPRDGSVGVLRAKLSVVGDARPVRDRSLAAWLLERYRLFVGQRSGGLAVAEVEHERWEAAEASVVEIEDRISAALGFAVEAEECVGHFSPGVEARFRAFGGVPIGGVWDGGPALAGASWSHPTRVHVAGRRGGR